MTIHGETVSVALRTFGEVDEYGNETEGWGVPFEVENVLVGKADTSDEIGDGQPYAIKADKRFCFPKGYDEDMRGALIWWRGMEYQVVGDPTPYTEANLPPLVSWNLRVEAARRDG